MKTVDKRIRVNAGDRLELEYNVKLNGVAGKDLSALTPKVEINAATPVFPDAYDIVGLDRGTFSCVFFGLTTQMTPDEYVIGAAMIMEDGDPVTFSEIGLELVGSAVTT